MIRIKLFNDTQEIIMDLKKENLNIPYFMAILSGHFKEQDSIDMQVNDPFSMARTVIELSDNRSKERRLLETVKDKNYLNISPNLSFLKKLEVKPEDFPVLVDLYQIYDGDDLVKCICRNLPGDCSKEIFDPNLILRMEEYFAQDYLCIADNTHLKIYNIRLQIVEQEVKTDQINTNLLRLFANHLLDNSEFIHEAKSSFNLSFTASFTDDVIGLSIYRDNKISFLEFPKHLLTQDEVFYPFIVSDDDQYLAVHNNGEVRIYDNLFNKISSFPFENEINLMEFSAIYNLLITTADKIHVYDFEREIWSYSANNINSISSRGSMIAFAQDSGITFYNLVSKEIYRIDNIGDIKPNNYQNFCKKTATRLEQEMPELNKMDRLKMAINEWIKISKDDIKFVFNHVAFISENLIAFCYNGVVTSRLLTVELVSRKIKEIEMFYPSSGITFSCYIRKYEKKYLRLI